MKKLSNLAGAAFLLGVGCSGEPRAVPPPDAGAPTEALPHGAWRFAGPSSTNGFPDSPLGGRVTAIVQHPIDTRLFFVASTGAGLWRTRDAGASWEPLVDEAASSLSVGAVALDRAAPDVLWIGLGDHYGPAAGGVLRSTDGGAHFTVVSDRLGSATTTNGLLVSSSGAVLAATDAGLFRAPPSGSFVPVLPDGGALGAVEAIQTVTDLGDGRFAAAAHLRSGADALLFSVDDGLSWAESTLATGLTTDRRIDRLAGATAPGATAGRVYALVTDPVTYGFSALWRSDDGGASYRNANPALTLSYRPPNARQTIGETDVSYTLGVDPELPDRVVLAGVHGVIASADGGASWQSIANPADVTGPDFPRLYVHADLAAVWMGTVAGARILMLGGDGGLAATDERVFTERAAPASGDAEGFPADWNWDHEWTRHLPNLMLYSVARAAVGAPVVAGLQDNGTIVGSDGHSFTQVAGGDGFGVFASARHPEVMMSSVNGSHLRSTDSGVSWQDAEAGLPTPKPYFEEPFTVTYGVLPADGTLNPEGLSVITPSNQGDRDAPTGCVYLSRDAGAHWNAACGEVRTTDGASSAGRFPEGLATVSAHPRQAAVWGAVAFSGDVYLTTDAGAHWSAAGRVPRMPPAGYMSLVQLAFAAGDPSGRSYFVYGTGLYGFAPSPDPSTAYLFRTNDGGTTFSPVMAAAGLPGAPVGALAVHPRRDDVLVAGTSVGVYASENGGTSWSRLGSALPNLYVTGLDLREGPGGAIDILAATYGRGLWELGGPE
jgi:photosystem II stability/assembly factor-like uncharacterized protein